jgi:hypothetical protein
MTLTRAESITGLTVFLIDGQDCIYAAGVRLTPREETVVGRGATEEEALTALVAANLAAVFNRVAERQKYRCADCGRIRPLARHHLRYRSEGRDDREENAVCLCAWCHEKRHREADRKARQFAISQEGI